MESHGEVVDALVIGGGPAGLSSAIALGRACRSTLVLDCQRAGRSDWGQTNHNYLGFPDGVSADELMARGRRQAERFGARFLAVEVLDLTRDGRTFVARTEDAAYRGRGVILATGVTDRWPEFPGHEAYIGRSMHWCIVCDGYEMRGQRVLVVGNDASAAEMAVQLLRFAQQVTLLTNDERIALPEPSIRSLERHGIGVVADRLVGARAKGLGVFASVLLAGGGEIEIDHLFGAQGAEPNSGLARGLDLALDGDSYIQVDTEAKTSLPGVYAAGDVTRLFSHQVATAAHEGATAAAALNYDLFKQEQEQAG